jgi:HprK-related kinase A
VKPVALKNASIDVIERTFPRAVLGPRCPGTRKGTVAHLAPLPDSVAERHRPAWPSLIVFPRFQAGSPTVVEPQAKSLAFRRLAFNSFNYALLGPSAFRAVAALVERCPAYALTFGDIGEAAAALGRSIEAPGSVPAN